MPEKIDQVPAELEFFKYQPSYTLRGQEFEYFDSFYEKNPETVEILLKSFADNVFDLSLNNINIFYLGHSELPLEEPFRLLEQDLIEESYEFISH